LTLRSLRNHLPHGRLDVLEIGFGRGILLSALLKEGHRVSGVDPGALERDIPVDIRRRATIHTRPIEEVELPDGAYDLIYGIHVVEHLQDPEAVFAACGRALRPGGLLYVMTPNAESRGLQLFKEAWWNLEDPTHVRFFTPRSIGLMLRSAGFARGVVRTPIWDSQTLEISSVLRLMGRHTGEHGVLSSRLMLPISAAMLPVAMLVRAAWPQLSPSMEVVAHLPGE